MRRGGIKEGAGERVERSFLCQPGEAQTAQIHPADVLAGFGRGHPRGEVEDPGLVPGDPGLEVGVTVTWTVF